MSEPSQLDPVDVDRWSPGRIGELVALYRNKRKLKVSQLARQVGVTPSLISQIERGNSRPSVATLFALAEALDVSVDVFAGRAPSPAPPQQAPQSVSAQAPEQAQAPAIAVLPAAQGAAGQPFDRYRVRRGERRTIQIAGGVTWEMLTPDRHNNVEFLELIYAPHAESNPQLYRHPGFEMVLVLKGRFEIHVGFDLYTLDEGDSIAFPSSLPHRYVNPTDYEARAVTTILREPAREAAVSDVAVAPSS